MKSMKGYICTIKNILEEKTKGIKIFRMPTSGLSLTKHYSTEQQRKEFCTDVTLMKTDAANSKCDVDLMLYSSQIKRIWFRTKSSESLTHLAIA